VRRGHRPLLAGRDPERLRRVAEALGLEHVALDLGDAEALRATVGRVGLVFHAAGPFVDTAPAMVDACLAARTHYVDITGEVSVFERILARDEEARAAGVVLMPGVGFDVVPTDCAARHVAAQISEPTALEIAFAIEGGVSGGTAATAVESFPTGVLVRRGGKLAPFPAGKSAMQIAMGDRTRTVVPITWGDLATAYRTTGIGDITVYMAVPRAMPSLMRVLVPVGGALLRLRPVRGFLRGLVTKLLGSPRRDRPEHTVVWARARNARGETAEVTITSGGSYPFTAASGVRAVERILASDLRGALTPASAFGADFVLEIPGTERR
jgi:short subunit dehydrogenase-like uncharacterized protein